MCDFFVLSLSLTFCIFFPYILNRKADTCNGGIQSFCKKKKLACIEWFVAISTIISIGNFFFEDVFFALPFVFRKGFINECCNILSYHFQIMLMGHIYFFHSTYIFLLISRNLVFR